MVGIDREEPFCGEGNNCFRMGTDSEGNACIAVAGQEDAPLPDGREALRALILEIKAGKADHLLQSAQLAVRGNVISTLRFFLRPASVELSAIGYCSP